VNAGIHLRSFLILTFVAAPHVVQNHAALLTIRKKMTAAIHLTK